MKFKNLFLFAVASLALLACSSENKSELPKSSGGKDKKAKVENTVAPVYLEFWEAWTQDELNSGILPVLKELRSKTVTGEDVALSYIMRSGAYAPVVGFVNVNDTAAVNATISRAYDDGLFKRTQVKFAWGKHAVPGAKYRELELYALRPESDGTASMEGDVVKNASADTGINGQNVIAVKLNDDAVSDWAELTERNIHRPVAIVIDGSVWSAPYVQSRISGGSLEIGGDFSPEECKKVAEALNASRGVKSEAENRAEATAKPIVFMTKEITPQGLLKVYEALKVAPSGKVAVKISTGEPGGHNFLQPSLIEGLVRKVNGTIVECNTAYKGPRYETESHLKVFKDHGFAAIAPIDLLDGYGEVKIPVKDTTYIKYNIVGENLLKYDWIVNLAHFKGHAMGGFGGVLKNQSIGIASANGKTYIHSAGATADKEVIWKHTAEQDKFIECMAAAAQSVHDYFDGRVIYINVMNNLSVDCDCDATPEDPKMKDVGILASLDPVALDQACVDLVFKYPSKKDDDAAPLIERINSRHGVHILEHAAKIGLGSREYELRSID